MTTQDIIYRFNLQVDDSSELSSDEELALANEIYRDICKDRQWEWLKAEATGTTSTIVPYVSLPVDFRELSINKYGDTVIFVGDDFSPYKVVSFSDRRNYRDMDGYCYIDYPNRRLVFTKQPTSAKSVEYDYVRWPGDLTINLEPEFDSAYHEIISYGMAAKFASIEQTEKNISYQNENRSDYLRILSDMAMVDSNIKLTM